MVKKSDIVKEAVRKEDWKKALHVAKDFRIGITQEQRDKMARAYECIVHPDFYQQIGIDIPEAIEQGKAVIKEYVENVRRKNIMKWDVKHDLAKQVIDGYLERAKVEMPENPVVTGLNDEERAIVSEELALMIASIRKRYKLQERLPEQKVKPEMAEEPVEEKAEVTTAIQEPAKEELAEQKPEVLAVQKAEEAEEKPKRRRKASETEKKPAAKRGRKKKAEQEENVETEQATA
ncbi:MAG: hypothetical protein HFH69_12540 [Lachnospiraceae bacterium]|nr:hypothetical protein [Lachnospiraceae bacterium]